MSSSAGEHRRHLRTTIVACVVLLLAIGGILLVTAPREPPFWGAPGSTGLWAVAFLIVGATIDRSRPGHPVGSRLLIAAMFAAVTFVATELSSESAWASDFVRGLAGTTASWVWAGAATALVTACLRFPDGNPPGRRWRWVEIVLWSFVAVMSAATVVSPVRLEGVPENPWAVTDAFVAISMAGDIVYAPLQLLLALCLAAPFVRYRSASVQARGQLRLLGVVAGLAAATILVFEVVLLRTADAATALAGTWATSLIIPTIPAVMGVAILRHHLYDIDRFVSRTVGYVAVTAILVGIYAASVVGLQAVLEPLTEGSDLAVAGSTLAVAGLFRPLRERVQGVVDRRFNRARYDAIRTMEQFGIRLRDEVDLATITTLLRGAVAETVAPQSVSVMTLGRDHPSEQ